MGKKEKGCRNRRGAGVLRWGEPRGGGRSANVFAGCACPPMYDKKRRAKKSLSPNFIPVYVLNNEFRDSANEKNTFSSLS